MIRDNDNNNSNEVQLINAADENGWQAIHEAVRSGDLEMVQYLVQLGCDVGAKVDNGGSALWIAKQFLDYDDPIVNFLIDIGAPADEDVE
jgi:ankyrin repeat protein